MTKRLKFSLVELLVVLSVMIVLISIYLTALRKMHSTSMSLECVNQLKNLGHLFAIYREDNNGKVVKNYSWNIHENYIGTLMQQGLLSDPDIAALICPWHKGKDYMESANDNPYSFLQMGYSVPAIGDLRSNEHKLNSQYIESTTHHARTANPSRLVMAYDGASLRSSYGLDGIGRDGNTVFPSILGDVNGNTAYYSILFMPHMEYTNVNMLDGSVSHLNLLDILSEMEHGDPYMSISDVAGFELTPIRLFAFPDGTKISHW